MKPRILIIEDEPTLLFAIQDYLDQQGYDVDGAAELEEASALLMNVAYDVVITDIRLTPVQNGEGLHVIEMIRERSLAARVVVLTGCGSISIEKAAHRLGVDRFIRKPVPLSVIAGTVSELVARS
ncbi:MAG TPA: response regulator [Thermoanaerobaculia bacterium]|nr:response regulator [Thermoanaerobaculia bacterium]